MSSASKFRIEFSIHTFKITIQRYYDDYGWPLVLDQEEIEMLAYSRQEDKLRIGGGVLG